MSWRAKAVLLLTPILGASSPSWSASSAYGIAVHPLPVGAQLPAFVVRDETNAPIALSAARLQGATVFVFYQGSWSSECRRYLRRIRDTELALRDAGFAVVFLSADRPELLRTDPQLAQLPYTLLSDSSMEAARAFGISRHLSDAAIEKYRHFGVDVESASGQTHHEIAVPAAFIVDATGMVRFAWWSSGPGIRLDPEQLLRAANKLSMKAGGTNTAKVTRK